MKHKPFFFRRLPTLLLLAAAVFFLTGAEATGCKRMHAELPSRPATNAKSSDFLLKKLRHRNLDKIQDLHAQARIVFEGGDESFSAAANIIWIRDSVMWVNVKKFGLEAARMLITRDSVFMLNRISKTWSARGMESLERQYSLPDGFGLLQQFILASAWIDPEMDLQADVKDNLHRLSGGNGRLSADYRLEEGSFLLKNESFMQLKDARNVSLSFENYKKNQVAGQFPYLRRIEAFSPEAGNLRFEIELTDVVFNEPKNFRFEIPRSYRQADE